jgi:predicted O-methyltransferase YrrM
VNGLVGKIRESAKQRGIRAVMESGCRFVLWKVMNKVLVPPMTLEFQRDARNAKTVEQAFDLAISFKYFGVSIGPFQIRDEITQLLQIVKRMKPRVVLEIGTAKGGTLFMFTRVANSDATLVSIDLPRRPFGEGYPAWIESFIRSFGEGDQSIHLIRADSHASSTLLQVQELLGEKRVDFLFIDGDHSFEGVKKDFEMYSPLVRPGGVVAFHDVCPGPPENVGGVPGFWHEVIKEHKCLSMVKDVNQGGYGIGLLYM